MMEYQIGGNATNVDASEAIANIQMNRSLFVQQLTAEPEVKPRAVEGLKTVEDVFNHYKPNVEVEFEKKDGTSVNETIHFNGLGDFKAGSITAQSPYLRQLNAEKEDYMKMMKQTTNKMVQNVVANQETKAAFMSALQSLINELDANQ